MSRYKKRDKKATAILATIGATVATVAIVYILGVDDEQEIDKIRGKRTRAWYNKDINKIPTQTFSKDFTDQENDDTAERNFKEYPY